MANSFVLLPRRQMALVILRPAAARIEQEFCERNIRISAMIAFLIVHKAAETHQRLLHLLMSVEPLLFARTDVRYPAIHELFRSVVQAKVLTVGERVVVDGRFNEVAGNIAFMIASVI